MKPNPIDLWLTTVAYSHSSSKKTRYSYKKSVQDYCTFAEITPEEILAEYEITDEKRFKRKHANQIQQWITELNNENLTTTTIRSKVGAVKSFYKYNSLSLGFIPQAKERILYHNRDIDANEIAQIIQLSKLREKAIYAMMAQSGLRPCLIQN
jgi:site-specific recombinase XerD